MNFARFNSILFAGGPLSVGSPADIRTALAAHLRASPITSIVGPRIYALAVPQRGSLPALVYQVISMPRGHHLDGRDGTAWARIQLKYLSTNQADNAKGAEALRQSLDGFTGLLGGQVTVMETLLANELDDYEAPTNKSDIGTFMIVQDYKFHIRHTS